MASPGLELFRRGAVDLIEARELEERLEREKPLRVKFGMDPSAPDLHLGHAVQLFKLRALQRAGHVIVLIVGDATAMVGDPSGRNKLRPQLTRAEVEANLATYTAQAGAILDLERTEVRRNSEWKSSPEPARATRSSEPMQVVPLKHAAAAEVAAELGRVLEHARLVADQRTNSLVISADSEADLAQVLELVEDLDVAKPR